MKYIRQNVFLDMRILMRRNFVIFLSENHKIAMPQGSAFLIGNDRFQ